MCLVARRVDAESATLLLEERPLGAPYLLARVQPRQHRVHVFRPRRDRAREREILLPPASSAASSATASAAASAGSSFAPNTPARYVRSDPPREFARASSPRRRGHRPRASGNGWNARRDGSPPRARSVWHPRRGTQGAHADCGHRGGELGVQRDEVVVGVVVGVVRIVGVEALTGGALVRASASVPGAQLADGAVDLRSHLVGQRGRGRRGAGTVGGSVATVMARWRAREWFERARARTRVEVAFDARRGRRAGAARWVCASDFEHGGAHPRKRRPANENVTSDETVEVRGGRRHSRDATAMGVFCLYIRVKLKREMIPEFKERWGILAKHVRENEPETLSYELCASDQNDDEFMIVEVCPSRKPPTLIPSSSPSPLSTRPLRAERYPSRAQLEDPHQTSAPFKAFKEWWTNSGVVLEKSGMSCVETGIGYAAK